MKTRQPIVLITGCSSGIGAALCREFHQNGCMVIATARRLESLDKLRSEGLETEELDVNNQDDILRVVSSAVEKSGRIDMLVNNAGYALLGPAVELTDSALRSQMETNLLAPLALIREITPSMKKNGKGKIVNIGSISGIVATPFSGAYCASKAALHSLSDALRMELSPFGIKVITVQPGAVRSNFGKTASRMAMNSLKPDSWYRNIKEAVKDRANMSQQDPMSAGDFAKRLVAKLLRDNPPSVIRLGKKSLLLPTLKWLLPVKTLDKVFMKKFRLVVLLK
jgi:short-subunit dehydrogenase